MKHQLRKTTLARTLGFACLGLMTHTLQAADLKIISQTTVETFQDLYGFPAIGAAIANDRKTLWQGTTNCDPNFTTNPIGCASSKMQLNDQVRVGSETKTFTATLILQMVDKGILSLDDTLNSLAAEFKVPNDDTIKLKHILNHTSTIPGYLSAPALPGFVSSLNSNPTIADQMAIEHGQTVATPMQLVTQTNSMKRTAGYSYSNTNYVILGYIAEKYSCTTKTQHNCLNYSQLIEKYISKPLNLTNSYYPQNDTFTGAHATGYIQLPKGKKISGSIDTMSTVGEYQTYFTNINPDTLFSAGGMITNLPDQIKFVRQLTTNNKKLLKKDTQYQRLHDLALPADSIQNYGLGILTLKSPLNNHPMAGHAGATTGWGSALFQNQADKLYYAVNTNMLFAAKTGDYPGAPAAVSASNIIFELDQNITLAQGTQGNCSNRKIQKYTLCMGTNVRTSPIIGKFPMLVIQNSNNKITGYDASKCQTKPDPFCTYNAPALASFGNDMQAVKLNKTAFTLSVGAVLEVTGRNSIGIQFDQGTSTATIAGTVTAKGRFSQAISGGNQNDMLLLQATATVNGPINLGAGQNTIIIEQGFKLTDKLYIDINDTIKTTFNGIEQTITFPDDGDKDNLPDMQITAHDGKTLNFKPSKQKSFTFGNKTIESDYIVTADINDDKVIDYVSWLDKRSSEMLFQPTYLENK